VFTDAHSTVTAVDGDRYPIRPPIMSRSSRGLGHHPFTVTTPVRIWYGTPLIIIMTKISIQINEELRKKLKVIALEKNITLNEVIVRAIKLKLQELEYDRSF
jgi:hypothetical protein